MIISPLVDKDAGKIAEFFAANFSDGWTESMLESAFKTGRFYAFGAVCDEKLSGVITCSVTDDTMDVEDIVVKKDCRRKSIASSLLSSVLIKMKKIGVKRVLLEVREGNTAAINLYKKFDFKVLSVRKKYYQDGENALVMIKEDIL